MLDLVFLQIQIFDEGGDADCPIARFCTSLGELQSGMPLPFLSFLSSDRLPAFASVRSTWPGVSLFLFIYKLLYARGSATLNAVAVLVSWFSRQFGCSQTHGSPDGTECEVSSLSQGSSVSFFLHDFCCILQPRTVRNSHHFPSFRMHTEKLWKDPALEFCKSASPLSKFATCSSTNEMRLPITTALSQSTANGPFVMVDGQPMLIELQGEIKTSAPASEEELAGQTFGKLDMSNPVCSLHYATGISLTMQQNKPTLKIAHHFLTGSIVKLQTPLAVLRHEFSAFSTREDPPSDEETRPAKRRKSLATSSPDTFSKYANRTPSRPLGRPTTLLPTSETSAPLSSSPLRVPTTPISVRDLQNGRHEIIGLIWNKILFNKRPEPAVSLGSDDQKEQG